MAPPGHTRLDVQKFDRAIRLTARVVRVSGTMGQTSTPCTEHPVGAQNVPPQGHRMYLREAAAVGGSLRCRTLLFCEPRCSSIDNESNNRQTLLMGVIVKFATHTRVSSWNAPQPGPTCPPGRTSTIILGATGADFATTSCQPCYVGFRVGRPCGDFASSMLRCRGAISEQSQSMVGLL